MMPSKRDIDRSDVASQALSVAAVASVIGPLTYVAVTLLHPPGIPDDLSATFREYAMSEHWIAIHIVQLAAMVAGLYGIAGLAVFALQIQGDACLLALLAAGFAVISIPVAVVLQAVDGIALKRAVDAWVADGGTVGSASFAAARSVRWIEEGVNALLGLNIGMAVILLGAMMTRSTVYPRWMGWIGSVIGIGVLIGAIVIADTGFSAAAQLWILARNPVLWIWTAIAGVMMWRRLRQLNSLGSDQQS
jgi:hypothetical protein